MRLKGFLEQPTDHCMRTYFMLAEPMYHKFSPWCVGSEPRHSRFLNWFRDMYHMYDRKPKFMFGFHSEYSHDNNSQLKKVHISYITYLSHTLHIYLIIMCMFQHHKCLSLSCNISVSYVSHYHLHVSAAYICVNIICLSSSVSASWCLSIMYMS